VEPIFFPFLGRVGKLWSRCYAFGGVSGAARSIIPLVRPPTVPERRWVVLFAQLYMLDAVWEHVFTSVARRSVGGDMEVIGEGREFAVIWELMNTKLRTSTSLRMA
jgi:hypothetical protein